jgi:hypothetical protein
MTGERIRFRFWLAALALLALLVGVGALVATSGRKPSRLHGSPSSSETEARPGPPSEAPTGAAPAPTAPPPPAALAPTTARAQASGSAPPADAVPPEHVAELDEFIPPPDSGGWSREEKAAYVRKAFADVAARERALEREQATAHAMGDARTEQQKAATLAALRARREYVERLMRAPGAMEGPVIGPPPSAATQGSNAGATQGDAGP